MSDPVCRLCSTYPLDDHDNWVYKAQQVIIYLSRNPYEADVLSSNSVVGLIRLFADDPAVVRFFNDYLRVSVCPPSPVAFQDLLDAREPTIGDTTVLTPEQAQARRTNVQEAIFKIQQRWPNLSGRRIINWSGWSPGSPSPI